MVMKWCDSNKLKTSLIKTNHHIHTHTPTFEEEKWQAVNEKDREKNEEKVKSTSD